MFYLKEIHTEGYSVNWTVTDILYREKTPYQELAVVETVEFGRALVLDGIVQTTERDEFIYHEMMSHVPLFSHPGAEEVLIIGGGDGGVLREVLKHPVQKVDLVEIDRRVVEVCRRYLPELACSFDDPRARVFYEDGVEYVKKTKNKYDVVIVDGSDPVGPAVVLYESSFYADIEKILKEDGLVVAQAESPIFFAASFCRVVANIKKVFPVSRVYLACVPTYVSGFWAFAAGSKGPDPSRPRSGKAAVDGLKYYTEEMHKASFVLPPFVARLIEG